jgi:spermidine/putrescine transport system substrate-binding protein
MSRAVCRLGSFNSAFNTQGAATRNLLDLASFGILALTLVMTLGACTSSKDSSTTPGAAREVNLAIWAAYLSPETQEEFTKKTGIKIRVSNYVSNEDLLAKVQAGASGIDVAVPSDYMVEVMTKTGLLQQLDMQKIPNRSGLDTQFLKQEFDPENKVSLPYAWLTSGIAVNRELFKGPITGWKDLFENKELAGKISLLDDVREVMGAALKANGYSVNSAEPAELEKAKETLKSVRPRVKMYRTDSIDPLVNKEIAVAQAYSSDALKAREKTNGQIEYILPAEGGTRTIDNLVILKSARHVAEAHELINFLISREANVAFVRKNFGGPVVSATKNALPDELQKSASLFPKIDQMKKFERLKDLGPNTRTYDRIWTEIKAE